MNRIQSQINFSGYAARNSLKPKTAFSANEFMPKVENYAEKLYPVYEESKASIYLPKESKDKPFICRPHGVGIVQAFPVFRDEKTGELKTRCIIQSRPAMGGIKTLEVPAGKYADEDPCETALEGAKRELEEETGLTPVKAIPLSSVPFATSPGITNELQDYVLVIAKDEGKERQLSESEKEQKASCIDVPLSTFTDTKKFLGWQKSLKEQRIIPTANVGVFKSILPKEVEKIAETCTEN